MPRLTGRVRQYLFAALAWALANFFAALASVVANFFAALASALAIFSAILTSALRNFSAALTVFMGIMIESAFPSGAPMAKRSERHRRSVNVIERHYLRGKCRQRHSWRGMAASFRELM
jgi:kynureninase